MKSKLEVKQVDGSWKWKATAGTFFSSQTREGRSAAQNEAYEQALNFILLADWEGVKPNTLKLIALAVSIISSVGTYIGVIA